MFSGPSAPATTRLRLDISYDGTDFAGWAIQPVVRTVQGVLEDATGVIIRGGARRPRLVVAGRTDVGVHAAGQVAHVDLDEEQAGRFLGPLRGGPDGGRLPLAEKFGRRLNGVLGQYSDVVITRASLAPEGFDARFSALWRHYEYRIADAVSLKDPRARRSTTWTPAHLDVDVMQEAARTLVGLHDFASFCRPRAGATTIRMLQEFSWERDADGVIVARVRADAFCHSMVRALVGASYAAGEAKIEAAELAPLRDAARRTNAFKVMPARGLTLVEVGYPDDSELARRAEETRATRVLQGADDSKGDPS